MKLLILVSLAPQIARSATACDSDAVSAETKLKRLSPNTFHKLCPSSGRGKFGQPICGDGTPFSFYFTRPTQRKLNDRKLLIELMGGGACWDSDTCDMQSDALTFPYTFDSLVGLSCSEIEYGSSGGDDGNDSPIKMLCAQNIGSVDFTEYNNIIVPYCTQDIHLGDHTAVYEQGETVRHYGSHNLLSVLKFVFTNFQNPSHIALTGCSAGGTALPVLYSLLNQHYNSFMKGGRSVQISVISDSPVYLTPDYFLQYGLPNWDISTIMKRIGFRYTNWSDSEEYPTKVWDYVLRRGSNRDQWGFITHTNDPVSLKYYTYMSGNGNGGDNNDNDNVEDQWWSQLSNSLSTIQEAHKNVQTFYIQDEGHCSFGLYYAMQQSGFEDWASSIFEEKFVLGSSHGSVPSFLVSFVCGTMIFAGTIYAKRTQHQPMMQDSVIVNEEFKIRSPWIQQIRSFLLRFQLNPLTAGFAVTISMYFVCMLIVEGFAHPLNNASLGPSAQGLSAFGINNPALIVYKSHFWRLLTANLLCSGVLTFAIVAYSLWNHTRYIEQRIQHTKVFAIVAVTIMLGSNLLYASVIDGASCASVSLVLGMNAFSIAMHCREQKSISPEGEVESDTGKDPPALESFPNPAFATPVFFFLTCIIFPFNSWLMLLSAVGIGAFVVPFMVGMDAPNVEQESVGRCSRFTTIKPWPARLLATIYTVMFLLLVFRIRKPDPTYKYPFLTGCQLVYNTEVGDIVSGYASNEDRRLEEDNFFDNTCAQMCIPHIAYRPARWGVHKILSISLQEGTCEEQGYQTHVADKTFSYLSYSLDVELYSMNYNDDQQN